MLTFCRLRPDHRSKYIQNHSRKKSLPKKKPTRSRKRNHTMLPSWAITLLIVIGGTGVLILVSIWCAMTRGGRPWLPRMLGPANPNAPPHQGGLVYHQQSAPAHQSVSEDSASEDSELAAYTQGVLHSVSQDAFDDIELSTRTQTQGVVTPGRQSEEEDSEQTRGSISTVNQA